MMYLYLREVHIACVILSGIGFPAGLWAPGRGSVGNAALGENRAASGRYRAPIERYRAGGHESAVSARTILVDHKLIGLLIYIGCGMAAFRFSQRSGADAVFFALALCAYAYIVSVALTRNPLAWLARLS